IPACQGHCPERRVLPHLDTASVEPFSGGNEVIWASYYATSGDLSSPTRLFVDRNSGLTSDPSATWAASDAAQTTRLWVTINDQRGGAAWTYFDVVAR
ncbi:MAG TPA: hypothetical protein VGQ57_13325, partial [Polyangiaceae bacterium]|nr:hypothetical protein [Polyangiaceae bacterium]